MSNSSKNMSECSIIQSIFIQVARVDLKLESIVSVGKKKNYINTVVACI